MNGASLEPRNVALGWMECGPEGKLKASTRARRRVEPKRATPGHEGMLDQLGTRF